MDHLCTWFIECTIYVNTLIITLEWQVTYCDMKYMLYVYVFMYLAHAQLESLS